MTLASCNRARFTVDTAQDFNNMQRIAEITAAQVLNPLQMIGSVPSNSAIKTSMREEIANNSK